MSDMEVQARQGKNKASVMGGFETVRISIGLAAAVVALSPFVVAQTSENAVEGGAFTYEERTTIDTIPFRSLEEESLANTVIEGGLEAPAAGVPVRPRTEEDFYLDPLALQPRDRRTDLGRTEIPVEFNFSNPKIIPGQTRGNTYQIIPQVQSNRTYETFNANTTTR
ncbi:hypothetical protein [Marinobacter sp. CHS3-4]|uniref:hypothetical protein n=1 Tax=Marinobacter sp. CHS3-4 TaxID=3045174 RepID=UPI0024B6257D|nr:hypothetical protein [Marinobacter sp. CHS3-4]MDI9243977.1 hypothetical protein [Marinobacter sp. CHS3-4]